MQQIGYFGPKGTFTEEVAQRLNSSVDGKLVPYETIFDLFKALEKNEVNMGVMPIENSLEGSVSATLDVMATGHKDLRITQEIDLRIQHHLIIQKDKKLSEIKEIISHPQALAQCQKYLYKKFPQCPTHQASSTARAVEMVSRAAYKNFAAIGSELAAGYYKNLKIVDRNISDSKNNETRFIVVSRNQVMPTGNDKTSIMFKIAKDRPGGLYSVLGELKKINLAKIESRPNKTGIGDYIFFIDMMGHAQDKNIARALKKIQKKVIQLKILGSYPVYSEKNMLDSKVLRQDFDWIRTRLSARGVPEQLLKDFKTADDAWRQKSLEAEEIRHEQKSLSKGKPTPEQLKTLKDMSTQVKLIGEQSQALQEKVNQIILQIPNIPDESVPPGSSENDNREVRRWGDPQKFEFDPKSHDELGVALGILNFEQGAKISGARFTVYHGWGAKLERALINFMLDTHTRAGYSETLPPFMVNAQALIGTGQLPKFEQDLFKTQVGYYLIPTAEVPVTNLHADEILPAEKLPLKYTAYTPCFRSEAGSYGKDTKGLIRQHQFNKVELVKFSKPEESMSELESLTADAEQILQQLELPYRVVELCAGDLGFSSAKTYDLEVWLPSQNTYREISSCSNFKDFQARRAKIRFKRDTQSKPEFVHTLNGSGLAVGRTFAAILENYQQADGSLVIPKVLRPYMQNFESIPVDS